MVSNKHRYVILKFWSVSESPKGPVPWDRNGPGPLFIYQVSRVIPNHRGRVRTTVHQHGYMVQSTNKAEDLTLGHRREEWPQLSLSAEYISTTLASLCLGVTKCLHLEISPRLSFSSSHCSNCNAELGVLLPTLGSYPPSSMKLCSAGVIVLCLKMRKLGSLNLSSLSADPWLVERRARTQTKVSWLPCSFGINVGLGLVSGNLFKKSNSWAESSKMSLPKRAGDF